MRSECRILVVDDEKNIRQVLKKLLQKNGYERVETASDAEDARQMILSDNYDLIVCDYHLPGMNGLELFQKVQEEAVPFVIITAVGTVALAVEALKQGVRDFISKPFDEDELLQVVAKILSEKTSGERSEIKTAQSKDLFLESKNPTIASIYKSLEKIKGKRINMLITGETGTGKGVLARTLHEWGDPKGSPFVKINCAAIPENLLESELFGHAKGAFTGAVQDKPGRFELAQGGTLFLDEIGELPYDLQAKLLSAIQDQEVTRVGEIQARKIDVRIVAATNADLSHAMEEKKFREDLYYRINLLEYRLPALRERVEDLPLLLDLFLQKYGETYEAPGKSLEPEAVELLKQYPWPGNIRELENLVQRLLLLSDSEKIGTEDVKNHLPSGDSPSNLLDEGKQKQETFERKKILAALQENGDNRTQTAKALGISRRTLLYRLKAYGI